MAEGQGFEPSVPVEDSITFLELHPIPRHPGAIGRGLCAGVRGWVRSAIGSDAQDASTSRQLAAISVGWGMGDNALAESAPLSSVRRH